MGITSPEPARALAKRLADERREFFDRDIRKSGPAPGISGKVPAYYIDRWKDLRNPPRQGAPL